MFLVIKEVVMGTEVKVLIYSMINNLIIAIIKLVGGIIFHLSSLMADGMHTFSDFITDIISLVSHQISKKKPTKYHPFGFGKVEYLSNLFVGIILLLLSIFIFVSSFTKESIIPSLNVIFLLVIVLSLKLLAIIIMNRVGNKIHSSLLITSVKESSADLYSTFGVIIITLLLQLANTYPILIYADLIGSILIGLIVFKTSLNIIIDNSLALIGEVDINKELIKEITLFIKKDENIKDVKVNLIKYGSYYRLQLTLVLDATLKLRKVTKITNKIKKDILRHHEFKIKYVTIYVTNEIH